MKKFVTVLLAFTLLLSLAACAGNNASSGSSAVSSAESDPAQESTVESTPAQTEETSSEDAPAETGDGLYATLEDYVATQEMQQAVQTIRDSLDTDLMDVELVGQGSKLIYNFTYQNLEDQDLSALGQALASALEQEDMQSTYTNIASTLSGMIEGGNVTVEVNYLAPDGTLLAGKEYAAQ